MRSIQTLHSFPLSAVKPLLELSGYREFCLSAMRRRLQRASHRRERSPSSGKKLEPWGEVEGIPYGRCPETGSLFLTQLPAPEEWASLLAEVSQYRHSNALFHQTLARSRTDHVYTPKLDWIQDALTLQGITRPRLLEVTTPPSEISALLKESGFFAELHTADEMALAHKSGTAPPPVNTAVLLESLDRIDEPSALLRSLSESLVEGGLLFVTALVSSGFDLQVLGLNNLYLYPPDRANCFTVEDLGRLIEANGFRLLEVSTPGVLDVQIVQAHLQSNSSLPVSSFEREIANSDEQTRSDFQDFLQRRGRSSFARFVAKKRT